MVINRYSFHFYATIVLGALFLLNSFSFFNETNAVLAPANFPSLNSSIDIRFPLEFCGEPVPMKHPEIKERMEKEILLALWNRPQVILWLKRSNRYFPHIERMLSAAGVPDDIKYLCVVESALRAHAGSSKGAVGFWQFLSSTARKYDLLVDSDIDERRNLFKSTDAAIRYLKDLYQLFGSWSLAAAAYNMGEDGLESEITIQKIKDYYKLYLSLETQRYVFKAVAAKLIMSSPHQYGFRISKKELYTPLQFDQVQVNCVQDIPLQIIAQSANTYFKVIKDFNPEVRGYYLCKGVHSIMIPKGSASGFHNQYKNNVNSWLKQEQAHIYIVTKGDSLTSIADRFNVPLPALLIWNRLSLRKHIYPGDRILVYPQKLINQETLQ
ncbi:MAG: transglycosylase SLT domain-containing protein [Candidatus Magnetomorum sp.]|nr:transglycosylase SLT domain-containing protein [Candidatus Magnetomorum sp.]